MFKKIWLIKTKKNILKDIVYGVATGDALGVPYEFRPRFVMNDNPCSGMVGEKVHNQPKGTWSDDTSLMLCLLDGMDFLKKTINFEQVARNMVNWINHGDFSATGDCFDYGETTEKAIRKMETCNGDFTSCGGTDVDSNGNGSLMRVAPLGLYLINENDFSKRFNIVSDISKLTHGHYISCLACFLYCELIRKICIDRINNNLKSKDEYFLYICNYQTIMKKGVLWREIYPEFINIWDVSFKEKPEENIQSGGYVINSLESAIWCFLNSSNIEEGLLMAVNLGNDTDTTAAIAGGLLGCYYGFDTIPTDWIKSLKNKKLINQILNNIQF